jgi:hypothetical protein
MQKQKMKYQIIEIEQIFSQIYTITLKQKN